MEEFASSKGQIQCQEICHTNLQDHALLFTPRNVYSNRNRSLQQPVLMNISSPKSLKMIEIKDLSSTTGCGECVRLEVKIKDMFLNLCSEFGQKMNTWKRLENGVKYRLFFTRIYAQNWKKFLFPFVGVEFFLHKISKDGTARKASRSSLMLCSTEDRRPGRNVERNPISPQKTKTNPVCSIENNSVKSSLKGKRGKAEKTITIEDLEPLFPGSLMDAAKSLKVSRSTLKRKCRQLGIREWPSTKSNKRSRTIPSCNNVPEFASEPQVPHQRLTPSDQTPRQDVGKIRNTLQLLPYKRKAQNESNSSCKQIKTSVQTNNGLLRNKMVFSHLRGFAPSQVEETCSPMMKCDREKKQMTTIVKAVYKDDMIRFQFPVKSTVTGLKKEVEQRLDLKAGTFKLKYWDDDDEWALLTCDSDWKDCVWISRLSNRHVVRLLVQSV